MRQAMQGSWLAAMVVGLVIWLGSACAFRQAEVWAQEPAPAPVSKQVAEEQQHQQGTWAVLSSVRDGQEGDPEIVASIRRMVMGDRVVWERDGKSFSGAALVLRPELEPKGLEIVPEGGPARGEHVLGIYKFEGQELVICMADLKEPRPTEFSAKPGSKTTLMRFKKVSEQTPQSLKSP